MTTAPKPRLSIVMPAYDEERRLPGSLTRLAQYVATLDRAVEVIVVDNGSTDRTAAVVEEARLRMPYLRLLRVSRPGKGGAVRSGMLAASGDHLMFCDVDFSMPITEIGKFIGLLDAGAPIVIASRELATSQRHDEPSRRHLMGRVFNRLVQILLVPGIDDTQCGFKAFQRPVGRHLFSLQRTHGWAFDVEILFIARLHGYRVQQLAIDWYYDADSRVKGLSATLSMVREVLRIRTYGLLGLYNRRPSPAPGYPPL